MNANPRLRPECPSRTTWTLSNGPNRPNSFSSSLSVVYRLSPKTPMQWLGSGSSLSPICRRLLDIGLRESLRLLPRDLDLDLRGDLDLEFPLLLLLLAGDLDLEPLLPGDLRAGDLEPLLAGDLLDRLGGGDLESLLAGDLLDRLGGGDLESLLAGDLDDLLAGDLESLLDSRLAGERERDLDPMTIY